MVCVRDVDICTLLSDQQIRSVCEGLPYQIHSFKVGCLMFRLPDLFRWRIEFTCEGYTMELKQKAMPEVRTCKRYIDVTIFKFCQSEVYLSPSWNIRVL